MKVKNIADIMAKYLVNCLTCTVYILLRMIPFADRERNFPKKAAATRLIPDTIVDPTTKEEGKVAGMELIS